MEKILKEIREGLKWNTNKITQHDNDVSSLKMEILKLQNRVNELEAERRRTKQVD